MKINRAQLAKLSLNKEAKASEVKPSKAKIKNQEAQENATALAAGFPPFTRGLYSRMYGQKPWTIRQYAGFSTAEQSNHFYKKNLAGGQKGLSVAFDLATHRGYDSDHVLAKADVGKAGVAIDSVADMKRLFKDIPLEKMSVSMTMNGAVLPIMAFYIAAAAEQGTDLKALKGTIQNDILKEFLVRNTYIYPPKASLDIVSHIFQYSSRYMPQFNSISISGYHMQEAGATAAQELAFTLANGLEYVKLGIKSGLDVDDFAPRLSFFWGVGMDFFTEIAKLRAARTIWANLMQAFHPKNKKSLMLRAHCQTSGWSLAAQDPFNNISRTSIEAMAAVLGGTQSLHTNSLDEAIALPTDFSAKIARNTQIHLQKETDLTHVVDPFAGSYALEEKTLALTKEVYELLEEIQEAGDIESLIETGAIKTKIEKAATLKQAQIDSGEEIIVGVNAFTETTEPPLNILEIDNIEVLNSQTLKLTALKENRDTAAVETALEALKKAAANSLNSKRKASHKNSTQDFDKENLLALAVAAAKKRATLGEISLALEAVYGRYEAKHNLFSGVYSRAIKQDETFVLAKEMTDNFLAKTGRRPRILLAKIGQDGHDRGIKIVATSLADIGFDVDLGPLFQTPEAAVKQAIENDVHILGLSSLAGGHKTIVKDMNECLLKAKATDIQIVLGGIIPKKEEESLTAMGVQAFFGPGTPMAEIAIKILRLLLK